MTEGNAIDGVAAKEGDGDAAKTVAVDRLVSVPIREVWRDEARDLTPWLADNLDDLNVALGMDLELEGSEVQVGPFSADLVLRDANTQERVVVENMIGSTDHDHLGKVITYAAGLSARHAVLVAETFRPEHRSALQWLNEHSTESMSFFGIVLRVWRIGDSSPAPQLEVVVEPDAWVRQVRAPTSAEVSGTQLTYRDFWSEFLPAFQARHPDWSRNRTPSTANWMSFPARKTGMYYSASFGWRPDGARGFRVLLYIDANDAGEATRRFKSLSARRPEIQAAFGRKFEWESPDGVRASWIACYFDGPARVQERDRWHELRTWAVERLGELRAAIQAHVDQLP